MKNKKEQKKSIITFIIMIGIIIIGIALTFGIRQMSSSVSNEKIYEGNLEEFIITFDIGDGTWESDSKYKDGFIYAQYGETLDEPKENIDLILEGYTLDGWYLDKNYTLEWNFENDIVTENMYLYAKWDINIYKVNFYNQYDLDDTLYYSLDVPYGSKFNEDFYYEGKEPLRYGYTFNSWISLNGSDVIKEDTDFICRYDTNEMFIITTNYLTSNGTILVESDIQVKEEGELYEIDVKDFLDQGYDTSFNSIIGIVSYDEFKDLEDENGYISINFNEEFKFYDVTINIFYTPAKSMYTVNYFLQDENNEYYIEDTINYDEDVFVGDEVFANAKTYEGYSVNNELSNFSTIVTVDDKATINIYYDRNSYYIYFQNTGDTYFEVKSVKYLDEIPEIDEPKKEGYKFKSWEWSYKEYNEEISIDEPYYMPNKDLYVTALWDTGETSYKIVYFVENADDENFTNIGTYVVDEILTETNIMDIKDALDLNRENYFMSLKETDYLCFTYDEELTLEKNNNFDINVSGDGTTTIKTYYSRNQYYLEFDMNEGSLYSPTLHAPDGNDYTKKSSSNYTIHAKYESYIADVWPTDVTFSGSNVHVGWKITSSAKNGASPSSSTMATKRYTLTFDMLSNLENESTTTYTGQHYSSLLYNKFEVYYYYEYIGDVDSLTDEEKDELVLYDGIYFMLQYEESVKCESSSLNAKSLTGVTVYDTVYTKSDSKYEFYYLRNDINITFYNVNQEYLTETIKYGQSLNVLSDIKPDKYPIVTSGEGEYIFLGWFLDEGCTEEVYWDTVLIDNLTLYASWEAPTYKVTFDLNGGTWNDTQDDYIKSDDEIYIEVSEGSHVDMPTNPTRDGYLFLGWFYTSTVNGVDTELNYLFDDTQKIYNDILLVAKWESNEEVNYTVRYILAEYDKDDELILDVNSYDNVLDLTDSKTFVGNVGETVEVDALYDILGDNEGFYVPDEVSKEFVLTSDENINIIYFFYTKVNSLEYSIYYTLDLDETYTRGDIPSEDVILDKKVETINDKEDLYVTENAKSISGYSMSKYYTYSMYLVSDSSKNIMYFYYNPVSMTVDYMVNFYFMDGNGKYDLDPDYTINDTKSIGSIIESSDYFDAYSGVLIGHTVDETLTDSYVILKESTESLNIYYKNDTYKVTYNLQGGSLVNNDLYNQLESEEDNFYINITYPNATLDIGESSKDGYLFLGWYSISLDEEHLEKYDFTKPVIEDIELYAIYCKEEEINISISWDDDSNRDGLRPESIKENLYQNDKQYNELEFNIENYNEDEDVWEESFIVQKYIFDDLECLEIDVYKLLEDVLEPVGIDAVYTLNATDIDDYESSLDDLNITYSHSPELVDKTVTKYWKDNHNQDGCRYQDEDGNLIEDYSLKMILYANGTEVESVNLTENDQIDDSTIDTWQYTWYDLYKYEDGVEINYTVMETGSPSLYSKKYIQSSLEVYNAYPPEKDVYVKVEWDDNGLELYRPDELETVLQVKLGDDEYEDYNGDEYEKVKVLNDENNWQTTWEYLEKYDDNGDEYEYYARLTEDSEELICGIYNLSTEVEEYEDPITKENMRTIIITLVYNQETVTKSITVSWDDSFNQDGIRPDAIDLTLVSDEETKLITLDKSNALENDNDTWQCEVSVGKSYNDKYSIYLNEISGYSIDVVEDGDSYIIKCTHQPETTIKTVTKLWNDSNNAYNTRSSFEVELYANDELAKTVILNDTNNWTYTWDDLDKYESGKEIIYTVKEIEPINIYNISYDQENLIITNSLKEYSYRVEYYYDGVLDETKTEVGYDTYGKEIEYTDKALYGYELDYIEGGPITENEDENVLKVYYKEKVQNVKLFKYGDDDEPLEGVIFYIIDENGKAITESTDNNGELTLKLPYGTYFIEEKETIYGYNLNDTKITILVNEDGVFRE